MQIAAPLYHLNENFKFTSDGVEKDMCFILKTVKFFLFGKINVEVDISFKR